MISTQSSAGDIAQNDIATGRISWLGVSSMEREQPGEWKPPGGAEPLWKSSDLLSEEGRYR